MARFDVYANPGASERKHTPSPLDLQSKYGDSLSARMTAPLRRESTFGNHAHNLNPALVIAGDSVVLDAAASDAGPVSTLGKPVADLRGARAPIQQAQEPLFGVF
jgi:toxin CcdB